MLEHERSRDDVSHVPTTQADSSTEAASGRFGRRSAGCRPRDAEEWTGVAEIGAEDTFAQGLGGGARDRCLLPS